MVKVGIIGFGVVGKSALAFLTSKQPLQATAHAHKGVLELMQRDYALTVWDKRLPDELEQGLLAEAGVPFVNGNQQHLGDFLASQDVVLTSPGVDLSGYAAYEHKVLCELDFFATYFRKPVVAITGSLGKTTITRLLGALANKCGQPQPLRVAVGGNVGIGMLDLIAKQDDLDAAVIELSSFQLERNTLFAPHVALFTNLYPNHLDRHKTLEAYGAAKMGLLRAQVPTDVAILAHELLTGPAAEVLAQQLPSLRAQLVITAPERLERAALEALPPVCRVLSLRDGELVLEQYSDGVVSDVCVLAQCVQFPAVTFASNWLQVIAGLMALGFAVEHILELIERTSAEELLPGLAHRVRHVSTIRGVDFYDDSKSTIVQATLAAVQRLALKKRPIILILGGLGKGIDRSSLMPALAQLPLIKQVFCFGPESGQFAGAAAYDSLEAVMEAVEGVMQPGDLVLFSPSGTSFDFFKNYEHRGQVFEQLVQKLA